MFERHKHYDFADRTVERVRRSKQNVALFVAPGESMLSIRATNPDTNVFASLFENNPENLIGIYDGKANALQISEDIDSVLENRSAS